MRPLLAALLLLILTACSAVGAPSASVAEETPPPTASLPASDEPAATVSVPPSAPTWEGDPAAGLALVRPANAEDATTQIFLVEADGSLRQVTGVSGGLGASHPVWSRDGSQIAFGGSKIGETGTRGQLGLVNADGTGERQIAEGQSPQWSPDDSQIAFVEVDDVTGEELSLYLADVGNGDITDLGLGYQPRWLGAGDELAFNANVFGSDGESSFALYALALDTGETSHIADDTYAYPSPDGAMLLLEHEGVLSLAAADGSGGRELVNGVNPVWSPDGTRFAFAYDHDADANPIHAIVDLEGQTVRDGIAGATPTWSPDGTRLAVEVYAPEMPIVQVVDVASGEVVWEMEGMQPAWRP